MSDNVRRLPEYLSQQSLAKNATSTSGPSSIVSCQNGWVGSYLYTPGQQCQSAWQYSGQASGGPQTGFPQNGEYVYYDTCANDDNQCFTGKACADARTYGCSCEPEPDLGGPSCESWTCTSCDPASNQRCAVQRIAFNGDAGACCLLAHSPGAGNSISTGWSNNGSQNYGKWSFITAAEAGYDDYTYTCDPNIIFDCTRAVPVSAISKECSAFIQHPATFQAWQPSATGYCSNYVNSINNISATTSVLSAAINGLDTIQNFDWGKNNIDEAKGISSILSYCQVKGGCDESLSNICKNNSYNDVITAYQNYINAADKTTPEAIANLNLVHACGCHLPTNEYENNEWGKLGITTSCDPICMITNVVPIYENNVPVQCSQNICILNDIKVDIINSNTGPISFNTICGSCGSGGSGGCRCVFSDISILESNSNTGGISFSQSCGYCSAPDPANPGLFIPISCIGGLPPSPLSPVLTIWDDIKIWISAHQFEMIIIIIFLIIAIFVVIWWLNKTPKVKDTNLGNKVCFNDLFGNYSNFNY